MAIDNNPSSEATSSALLSRSIMTTAFRNSAFVLGGQILLKVFAFLFNVYIVRKLGAVHFGRYSAVVAYVMIFGIFTDIGMTPYAIRQMAEDLKRTEWLLPNIIVMRSIFSLVIIVIAPVSAILIGKETDIVLGILIASGGQLLYAIQGPLESAITARERLDFRAVFTVANQLVFWGLGVALLIIGMGFIGLLWASLAGVFVAAILSAWALIGRLGLKDLRLDPRKWILILKAAFPFGVSSLADAFLQRFDTVLMSIILTDAAVGWYNAPITLIIMALIIAQSVAIALYPSLVRGYTVDNETLGNVVSRAIKYLLALCIPIAVGGTILSDQIILTLYTEEFAASIQVFRIALWALPSLFLLELVARVANTLHLERKAARIDLYNATFTVILNLVLVPTMGVIGGAIALVIGRLIRLSQFWQLIGNRVLIGSELGSIFRVILASSFMGGTAILLRDLPLAINILISAVVYGVLLFRFGFVSVREIRSLWNALGQQNKPTEISQ